MTAGDGGDADLRKEGNRVQVPHPEGEGTVKGIFVAPADASSKPRFGWVRLTEGPEKGSTVRVPYDAIKPA